MLSGSRGWWFRASRVCPRPGWPGRAGSGSATARSARRSGRTSCRWPRDRSRARRRGRAPVRAPPSRPSASSMLAVSPSVISVSPRASGERDSRSHHLQGRAGAFDRPEHGSRGCCAGARPRGPAPPRWRARSPPGSRPARPGRQVSSGPGRDSRAHGQAWAGRAARPARAPARRSRSRPRVRPCSASARCELR